MTELEELEEQATNLERQIQKHNDAIESWQWDIEDIEELMEAEQDSRDALQPQLDELYETIYELRAAEDDEL